MDVEPAIILVARDAAVRRAAADFIDKSTLKAEVCVLPRDPQDGRMAVDLDADQAVVGGRILPSPYRLGALLDSFALYLAQGSASGLVIGPYVLDPQKGLLISARNPDGIRLTEKEQALLEILADTDGGIVSRGDLLARVWEYAPDVDTHTLETHIYRLRQKIEDDPSVPQIVLTDGNGYRLAGL